MKSRFFSFNFFLFIISRRVYFFLGFIFFWSVNELDLLSDRWLKSVGFRFHRISVPQHHELRAKEAIIRKGEYVISERADRKKLKLEFALPLGQSR